MMEAKYAIHQKLANFVQKKDIYSNRYKNIIFGMKCVFYVPEHNPKGGPNEIGFLRSRNEKNKT